MFATANPSGGGFDVRCWKARPLLRIRYGRFDVKHKLSNQEPQENDGAMGWFAFVAALTGDGGPRTSRRL